jgi:hypothetical protein
MPICASAACRLRTIADPLPWAVSLNLRPDCTILAPDRAIDGFASTGNSRHILQESDSTCVTL